MSLIHMQYYYHAPIHPVVIISRNSSQILESCLLLSSMCVCVCVWERKMFDSV